MFMIAVFTGEVGEVGVRSVRGERGEVGEVGARGEVGVAQNVWINNIMKISISLIQKFL